MDGVKITLSVCSGLAGNKNDKDFFLDVLTFQKNIIRLFVVQFMQECD